MGWLKEYPRKYYEKYERISVHNDGGWYQVYKLPQDVYAICEPQHFQEVNFFLIIGEKCAVLLDSGEGFCPIKPLINELYDGNIITFNSHFHFDHIGSNYLFEPVHVWDDPYVRKVSENGLPKEALGAQLNEEMFQFGYPETLNHKEFRIPPYQTAFVSDGDIFDLGGRTLKVYHTPGHSQDSIMLYDESKKILFTGDTFYPGALYAHFDCNEFGHGNIDDYISSMNRLVKEIPDDVMLYCSHNEFIMPCCKLKETAEALAAIKNSTAKSNSDRDVALGHTYLEGGKPIAEYQCDGFSIVYRLDK